MSVETAYETFDIHQAPLEGTTLIEASAGTGKTYTLTGLFLRLLVDRKLPVERILVVTFTEAATGELKDRIRSRLLGALDVLSGGTSDDPFLQSLPAWRTRGGRSGPAPGGSGLRPCRYLYDPRVLPARPGRVRLRDRRLL